jgi:hypothetical protein
MARRWQWRLGWTLALTLAPECALAIQTHGHPEGLYAHQLGHVAFFGAMLSICWQIWQRGLINRRGFHRLFWASLLFAAWNVLTFWGHIAEEHLDPAAIDARAGHLFRQLHINDLNALIFYLAKLDHLILIPALIVFFLALRAFRAEQVKGAAP